MSIKNCSKLFVIKKVLSKIFETFILIMSSSFKITLIIKCISLYFCFSFCLLIIIIFAISIANFNVCSILQALYTNFSL